MFFSVLFARTNKVRVTAESANIYAKPNIKSYVIETVKKETILNLFQSQKLSQVWYYISLYSEKRKAPVAGFVKVTAVARIENFQKKSTDIKEKLKEEKKPKIKRLFKEKEIKPLSPKTTNIKKISKLNKIKITAESASIYAKPDIKSYVIETIKKESVLNLLQKQKLSRVWYHVSFYSERRKAYISGFVKVTAAEKTVPFQKKPKEVKKELKKELKSKITSGSRQRPVNPRKIKNSNKENRQKEKLSITPLVLEKTASSQKSTMRQKKLEEKIFKTVSPTKEVVAFQKITEPAVEIKTEEMSSLNPASTFVITAFKKTKKETKDKKLLIATSPPGETKAFQNRKEGKRQKEKRPIETRIRQVPAKSKAVPKISYPKKVKVTAESTNIYAKPNIKSQVIKTVKKETILILSKTQKNPKIWNNITYYSEKRKAYISGFVKATAVEKIDHLQIESKEIKEKLEKQEKKTPASPSPAKEIISIKKLEKEVSKIKKLPIELEIKPTPLKTIHIQKRISQVRVFLQDSLAETAYEVKKSFKKEENELKKEKILINKPHKEAKIKPMPTPPRKRISKGKFRLLTLGIGYGQSYGGAGGFIQLNTKAGLSFHGGIGYFPAYLFYSEADWVRGTMLYSGGLKYYLPLGLDPFNFYLDLQFCGIGVEAARVFNGKFYYGPLLNNVQKTLWGPSLLGGVEVKIGRVGLNGGLGASYNTTKADWLEQNIFLTFDLGLLLYF